MPKIITFGELMIRLQPYNYERLVQADSLQFRFGGGEANVAVSLANFGMDAAFVTKLPAHAVGQAAVNALRRYGVDTSMIVRGGARVGIYFNEKGASQRPGVCIYDRAHSAIAEASPADFDWDRIFAGADWFHFSGITPALGDNVAAICGEAVRAARARGVKVSCDLNYRSKLWTMDAARLVMGELLPCVDVGIFGREDPRYFFAMDFEPSLLEGGRLNDEGCAFAARALSEKYGFEAVAVTRRDSLSATDNRWSAMLYDGADCRFSKSYDLHIVDRIGGGDGFSAGLIYALLSGYDTRRAVEFAAAAAALKHSVEGDFNMVTAAEVESLALGDGSGRVRR